MRARLAIAATLLALLAGIVVLLSASRPQRTGANGVLPQAYEIFLKPAQTACQGVTVPAGTRSISLYVGTYARPGPALRVALRGAGVRVNVRGGYGGEELPIAIPRIKRLTPARLCVINHGPGRLALAGTAGTGAVSTLDGQSRPQAMQVVYYGRDSSSWTLAGSVSRRVTLLDFGGTGPWLFWLLVGLMVAAAGAATTLIAREVRR